MDVDPPEGRRAAIALSAPFWKLFAAARGASFQQMVGSFPVARNVRRRAIDYANQADAKRKVTRGSIPHGAFEGGSVSTMTSARIIVVEDDRGAARGIQQQLERIGHQVLGTAAREEDAVSLAFQRRPDLVLIDIRLERGIDGVDVMARIRGRFRCPVVFLAAHADDEIARRALQVEPFGFLLEPFEDLRLRIVIEMTLNKHRAESGSRESERRYATTLSIISDAIIATDGDARVTFLNPVAQSLTGWSEEEALGRGVTEVFRIVSEETRESLEDPAVKAIRLGTSVGIANHEILISRDGREALIDDWGSPIVDDFGETTGAVLAFRDIVWGDRASEELREARETLERSGRLTAMGELTVSIAHEVNQSLMAIVTNAAACLQWLTPESLNIEEARRAAERATRDGHRAGQVIANIRALARKSPPERTELDINATILEVLLLMRVELRRHAIAVETELATDLGPVRGDRVQFQQVILNLIVNAIDAIKASEHSPRLLGIRSQRGDPSRILVAVSDTGDGLDPATEHRIFDTLFTTKPEGVGMGLSICRSIVEAHGGRIWASSNQPHGSIFWFTVPALSPAAPGEAP